MVAVAVVDEGVALRNGGVSLPVMVLDPWCENMQAIFACRLQPTLIGLDEQLLVMLEDAATAQGVDMIEVHVKLDTGMHRVGLAEDELEAFAAMMGRHPVSAPSQPSATSPRPTVPTSRTTHRGSSTASPA